jgi:hypothetical protein
VAGGIYERGIVEERHAVTGFAADAEDMPAEQYTRKRSRQN